MSRYRTRMTGAEKFVLVFAVFFALAFNMVFALCFVGLPMILFHAPTWAWVGAVLVAVYASVDGTKS